MSNLSYLTDILTKKLNLTADEGEEFITAFFKVVEDGLKEDKLVKVKGFGTFKLAKVNARESVDVNTGERIVIESREKVIFTPDNSLRDLVNSPFVQFETVLLNGEVDFSSIDAKYASEEIRETVQADLEQMKLEEEKQVAEVVEEEEDAYDGEAPVVTLSLTAEQVSSLNKQVIKPAESEEQPAEGVAETVEMLQAEPLVSTEVLSVAEEVLPAEKDETPEEPEVQDEESEPTQRPLTVYVLIACAIVILGAIAAYRFYPRNNSAEASQSAKKQIRMQASMHKTISKDSAILALRQTQQRETLVNADSLRQSREAALQLRYNRDARVRTGAYRITGITQTVTVKAGQTLSSISEFYLGAGMECYVEAVNGKKHVQAGERIKIPRLQLKKKSKRP